MKSQYIVIFICFSKNSLLFLQKSQYIGIMKSIGTQIKERRKSLRVTQRQLADLSGVGINTLTKIERNEANPSLSVLNKILDTLGLVLTTRTKDLDEV